MTTFFQFFDYLVSIAPIRWFLIVLIFLWLCSAILLLIIGDELTVDYPVYDDEDIIDRNRKQ